MSTRHVLKPIVGFLTVLGLETNRVPSVSEFRTAYRAKLYLHPDKAGEGSTAEFQKITEAADAVLKFLTANSNLQPEVEPEIDNDILIGLVKSNDLVYNGQSTTFMLSEDEVEAWMHKFEVELGRSKPLTNSTTDIQFIKESWSLDTEQSCPVTTFGSVNANYYSTTGKVMIQGKSYLQFTTFVIPNMVERMKNAKQALPAPVAPVAPLAEETDEFFETIESELLRTNDDSGAILLRGFKRMEDSVVALRTDLIRKVDESLLNADGKENSKLDAINTKLDNLESLLHENKCELKEVNDKLTEIAGKDASVKLEQSDIDGIATAVSNISCSKKSELDGIASAIKDVRDKLDDDNKLDDIVETNRKVLAKLDVVKDLSDAFSANLSKLENIFEKDVLRNVATNSEQSVSALNSLNGHMVNLLTKFDRLPKAATTDDTTVDDTNVEPSELIVEEAPKKIKKCKFFSSSVALGSDTKKLEYELDCKVEMVETYHIIENPTADDPEKFLENMLKTHIKAGEVDFIIISVGSNDITFLKNDRDMLTLSQEAIVHSNKLVKIATEMSVKFGIDVFVTERPARYDRRDKDPKGVKTVLNDSANGMLIALTSVLERVHAIKLPALENLPERARKALYKNDGIHLTNDGLAVFEDSLVAGIKNIFTDLNTSKEQRTPPSASPPHGNRGGGRRERGNGTRNGYPHSDHDRRGGGARGQRYHNDRQQQQYGRPPHQQQRYRNNWSGDGQQHGMPDMMRDFMAFINNGSGGYRSRY